MNVKSILTAVVVLVTMSLATGCGTAIGEGVGVIRGGRGSVIPIPARRPDPRLLTGYTSFSIGTINDETGLVPPGFFRDTKRQFQKELADQSIRTSGVRACVIEGDVVHFETEGPSALLLGPLEEIVVRARLIDKETGRVLATANCIGRIDTRLNKSTVKIAEGLGKAFAAWIKANHPVSLKD